MHSYGGEDDLILKHFGDFKGRFLDLGAWDGKEISNTFAFAERGWFGVAVEASYTGVSGWLGNLALNPRITLVNAAMGVTRGIADFFHVPGCESTASERIKLRTSPRQTAQAYKIATVTIDDIIREFPGSFDYVSIDIEDWSIPVMQTIPYDKLDTKVVCVEYLHKDMFGVQENHVIIEWMAKRWGFRELATTSENVVMTR